MLIIYSAVMVPFRVCFASEATGGAWYLEVSITLLFLVGPRAQFQHGLRGGGLLGGFAP